VVEQALLVPSLKLLKQSLSREFPTGPGFQARGTERLVPRPEEPLGGIPEAEIVQLQPFSRMLLRADRADHDGFAPALIRPTWRTERNAARRPQRIRPAAEKSPAGAEQGIAYSPARQRTSPTMMIANL
jgi:hypothetical protein